MRDTHRKLLQICSMLMLLMLLLCGCGGESTNIDSEKKNEVDGVIFENDLMSIAGVSTDEYLEVFKTQEITFKYFASDFAELKSPVVLNFGGSLLQVVPGDDYLDELPCSVLSVFEEDNETVITNNLEEFYICQDEQGNISIYYETYNLYAEEEEGNTIKKYLNLKAYKIEFTYYVTDLKPEMEMI